MTNITQVDLLGRSQGCPPDYMLSILTNSRNTLLHSHLLNTLTQDLDRLERDLYQALIDRDMKRVGKVRRLMRNLIDSNEEKKGYDFSCDLFLDFPDKYKSKPTFRGC